MNVEDAISIYSNSLDDSDEKSKNFLIALSFLATLISQGVDVKKYICDTDTNSVLNQSFIDKAIEFANIMKKDIRCFLIHNNPVFEKMLNINNMYGGQGAREDAIKESAAEIGEKLKEKKKADADAKKLKEDEKTSATGVEEKKKVGDAVSTASTKKDGQAFIDAVKTFAETYNALADKSLVEGISDKQKNVLKDVVKKLGITADVVTSGSFDMKTFFEALGYEVSPDIIPHDQVIFQLSEFYTNLKEADPKFNISVPKILAIFKDYKNTLFKNNSKYESLFNYQTSYTNEKFYDDDGPIKGEKGVNVCGQDKECLNLMTQCLAGKNIEKCKKFMQKDTFYKSAAESVKNLDIDSVIMFLNAYKVNVNKKSGQIERPEDYMKRLYDYAFDNNDKNFTLDDWNKINNNIPLKSFIGYLVDKYNEYKMVEGKNAINATGAYGVAKVTKETDSSPQLSSYLPEIRRKVNDYAITLGLGNVLSLGPSFVLNGGGNDKKKYLSNIINMHGGSMPSPFEIINIYEQSLESAKQILKQHNSALDSSDEEYFKKIMAETKSSLQKIYEIHEIARMYASLVINNSINDGESVSDLMDMNRLINKHSKAVNKLSSLNLKGANVVSAIERATSDTFNGASFRK